MTALLRTDLNDFLFTPVAADENGMHLTMLSALARSGVDPWAEAAELAELPKATAVEKLVELLATVRNGPAAGSDTSALATRLVEQLHAPPKAQPAPRPAATPWDSSPDEASRRKRLRLALYSVLALVVIVLGNWLLSRQFAVPAAETSTSEPR